MANTEGQRVRESLQWVQQLLEPGISDPVLLQAESPGETAITFEQAMQLTASQYSDVVEERTILDLCGWPGCEQNLGPVPDQKYHISLERRQVIDLTQRKKFCSSDCYRASKFYSAQLAPLPNWPAQSSFLKPETAACSVPCKNVIQLPPTRPQKPQQQPMVPASSQYLEQPPSQHTHHHTIQQPGHPASLPHPPPITEHPSIPHPPPITEHPSLSHPPPITENPSIPHPPPITEHPSLPHPPPITEHPSLPHPPPITEHPSLPHPPPITEQFPPTQPRDSQTHRLSSVDRLLNAFSSWPTQQTLELAHNVDNKDEKRKDWKDGGGGGGRRGEGEVFLPPVHSVTQTQLQRNILLQQLRRSLPGVAGALGLTVQHTLPLLTALINTFRVDRHSIMFRPSEWKVIILVLLSSQLGQDFSHSHRPLAEQWLTAVGASHAHLTSMISSLAHPAP